MTMVMVTVTANSRKSLPTMPPSINNGMNTATSDRLIETMVKPISDEPSRDSLECRLAALEVSLDVLDHDDSVIDYEANRDAQAHQREVVQTEAAGIHHGHRAYECERYGDARNGCRPGASKEYEDHGDDQHDGKKERSFHVCHRRSDRRRAIAEQRDMERLRRERLQLGQHRLDSIDGLYDIGPGQLGNGQQYGRPAIRPCGELRVFCPIDRTTDVAYANRRACVIGDDRIIPGACRQKLVIVVDRIGSRRPLDTPLRRIRGGRYDHRANVLERQPPAGDLARIDLDSHSRLLLAEYSDLRNA